MKVIFENYFLTPEEIIKCCEISNAAGVDFVKTSTGYTPTGAKLEDVKLMRAHTDPKTGLTPGGATLSLQDYMPYYAAGVTPPRTRAAAEIVDEAVRRGW